MDNNLYRNKKIFSKKGAIIGGVTGAISGFLTGLLKSEFGFDFLTRISIAIFVSIIVGGILYLFLKNK